MKRIITAALLAGVSTAVAASPATQDWQYFDLRYLDADLDTGFEEVGVKGLGLKGSVQTSGNSFMQFDLQTLNGDVYGYDISGRDISLGIGGAWASGGSADFFLVGKLINSHAEIDGIFDDSETGFGFDFGFRSGTSSAEFYAMANYVNFDAGSDTGFTFGAAFGGETARFLVEMQTGDDYDAMVLGLRIR